MEIYWRFTIINEFCSAEKGFCKLQARAVVVGSINYACLKIINTFWYNLLFAWFVPLIEEFEALVHIFCACHKKKKLP